MQNRNWSSMRCVVAACCLTLATSAVSHARAESPHKPTRDLHATTAQIPAGSFQPLYGTPGHRVAVPAFSLDRYPVTRAEFAQFVMDHPEWRRSAVHADGYLADWPGDTRYGDASDASRPVTRVTQTAAAAYCSARGKRLPTVDEWEYAAAASVTKRDGTTDPSFRQVLMDAYTRARPAKAAPIGSGFTNAFGVSDMHGVVWEWTQAAADTHMNMQRHAAHDMSCAGSAAGASDATNFAAFLRYAYRSGLHATSTAPNLGFRCAGAQ